MKLQDYINKHGNVEIEEKQLNELLGIKESKVWKPQLCDKFWSINALGDIAATYWQSTNDSHEALWLMGNVFKTKEEAEFAVEKRKVKVELQRYADEHNECEIDWEDSSQEKKYIKFHHDYNEFSIRNSFVEQHSNTVYFTSKEIAEQAIQAIGEERLKKYYFGVEE